MTLNKKKLNKLEQYILSITPITWYDKISKFLEYTLTKYNNYLEEKSLNNHIKSLLQLEADEYLLKFKFTLLDNVKKLLLNSAIAGYQSKLNHKVQLNIANEMLENISVLKDVVGLQTLPAPIGMIYRLIYKQKPDKLDAITLEAYAVECTTRKLKTEYSIESMLDLSINHNVIYENEIISIIGTEAANDIITEILNDFIKVTRHNPGKISTNLNMNEIYASANNIAKDTRRGEANFIIVSPVTLAKLQTEFPDKWENASNKKSNTILWYAGVLDKKFKVLCTTHSGFNDKMLMGYKGKVPQDSGFIFAPYILIGSSGISIDADTYGLRQSFYTRYGKYADYPNKDDGYSNSINYYKMLDISDIEN